ncbi:hypothetical protein [Lutibacter citreus]|uniref:hypothetical protein n=1 Tax=Lutibacter citreus TaxID=2138210 RepID=UPI000DBE9BF5|nr:hypothetical protein [Lutibacter citreus]
MLEYKFNENSNILEVNYSGTVTLSEIVNYIINTKNNKKYPRTLKIISNSEKAIFDFSIDDLNIIVEENNKSLKNYDCIIDAILIDNPINTVLTMLYKELAEINNYKIEIFATKSAALNWLNNS